jgi:hypothetical protein
MPLEGRMHQQLMFKLDQEPDGAGLRCDSGGLFLGRDALLQEDGYGKFEARPASELQKILRRGDEASWVSRLRSVELVANALNNDDMARAMIAAVLMRLPDPGSTDDPLAKAGFNPDEPRDEKGQWTRGGSSDTSIWHMLGSELSDRAKAMLSAIGRAEISESDANLAANAAEAKAIADGLRAFANYRAKPWIGPDGTPVQVPVINTGDPYADLLAQAGQKQFEPNAPLLRPGTNADWIDPLINVVSAAAMAVGPAVRSAGPIVEALDTAAPPAAESDMLIGNSGFGSIDQFTDAAISKYQAFYDQGYALALDRAEQGLIVNRPLVIGNATDMYARYGLRDWLVNVEGIEEGSGQIIQVNRRLYDPFGSGDYRVPDVYIPGSKTILDGSMQFKTSSMPQISDYRTFSGGANVVVIRPSAAPPRAVVGSYGIVY